jgi:hypothetical protein
MTGLGKDLADHQLGGISEGVQGHQGPAYCHCPQEHIGQLDERVQALLPSDQDPQISRQPRKQGALCGVHNGVVFPNVRPFLFTATNHQGSICCH